MTQRLRDAAALTEAMQAAHGGNLRPTHLEKDEEYLLELPESVEVSELHVNDWDLRHVHGR